MRAAVSCVFLILFAGCASSPNGSGTSEFQFVITREQIADSNETTLFGVVDRYHPEWLQVSRPFELLIVDDDLRRMGVGTTSGLDLLKMRGIEGVYALEYLNSIRARSLIRNMASAQTAIIVRTRPGGGS
jgi:hypothetical protein